MTTEPTTVADEIAANRPDLVSIEQSWLRGCPIHDAGIPADCECPDGDPREVIRRLIDEIRRLEAMRPVVEAARAWRAGLKIVSETGADKRLNDELRTKNRIALQDAVDALDGAS